MLEYGSFYNPALKNQPNLYHRVISVHQLLVAMREQTPVSKSGFLFVGNSLVLDFLNTRPVPDNEPVELLPDFAALLQWSLAAGAIDVMAVKNLQRWKGSATADRFMQRVRSFRERLRGEILRWEKGAMVRNATLTELNKLLAQYPMGTKLLHMGNGNLEMRPYCLARRPEDLLAPIVHSAAVMFTSTDRSRVRKCGRCVLHFVDTSKKGTRRWCSMQLCGNRLKVAAYAARQKSANNR